MILDSNKLLKLGDIFHGKAWIGGEAEGIVSINGVAVARQVVALEQPNLEVSAKAWSFPNGEYVLPNLDKDKLYIVMAIDYKGEYEPVAYSHIKPYVSESK